MTAKTTKSTKDTTPAKKPTASVETAAPKAQPGDAVACLPRACWGRVQDVVVGADGSYCYVVGLSNGETVELRGRELARG